RRKTFADRARCADPSIRGREWTPLPKTTDPETFLLKSSLSQLLRARFTASGRSMVEKVSAIGDDDEPRSSDAGLDLLRERRRGGLIAVADEHQGRTLDRGEERPCIRPRHDRLLLAQERLRSGLLGHEAHARAQRFVILPVAMDEHGKLQRRHLGES